MQADFLQTECFVLPFEEIHFRNFREQLDVHHGDVILTVLPVMQFYSTKLLSWPLTLDYMKLLPQTIAVSALHPLDPEQNLEFRVQWTALPSIEEPLPACRADVYQKGELRARVEVAFHQRQPRYKPHQFQAPKYANKENVSWTFEEDLKTSFLEVTGCEDPMYLSEEFSRAMGMSYPLFPDLLLLFRLWRWQQGHEDKKVKRIEVTLGQPALSSRTLNLYSNLVQDGVRGYLLDDLQRPIFEDFSIQWEMGRH